MIIDDTNHAVSFSFIRQFLLFDTLQEARLKVHQDIWRTVWRSVQAGEDVLSPNHTLHMLRVKAGRYAYIIDRTSTELEMARSCDVTMLHFQFIPLHYSVGLQNNSAYKELVNKA